MAKRAVFFDLGGTLLVMRRDRIFRTVLAQEGYPLGIDRIHAAYSEAESSWLKRHGHRNLGPERSVESYRRLDGSAFREIYPDAPRSEVFRVSRLIRERWPELEGRFPPRLYRDVVPALDRLRRQGYHLGLVSNGPPETVLTIRKLGLDHYMTNVVISGDVGVSKPDPAIFEAAMKNAGVGPSDTLHVGDVYEADVVGAKRAGITGVLIDRNGPSRSYDCRTIRTLQDIFPLLV
ncbi:MAG TPA: HAD family hydrolase [Nitrososphaerales archaeon]|nr:HAD family hydrolase [Nitrososphaerales archaeon]